MLTRLAITLLLLTSAVATAPLREQLNATAPRAPENQDPLYLPNVHAIRAITLGFDNFTADVLWFNTLNYFGKQTREKQDLRWLAHMCDLVTQLDSRARHVFEFCGTLLSWVAKDPEASNSILQRGIETDPSYWRYHYLRGFNSYYFLDDAKTAGRELQTAAMLPGAPPLVGLIATRLLSSSDDAHVAIAFLQDLLKNTSSPDARRTLLERLKSAQLTADIQTLERAVAFAHKKGHAITSLEQLVSLNIIRDLPRDPFGGEYRLNPDSGVIDSTSGDRGLRVRKKSSKHEEMKATAAHD